MKFNKILLLASLGVLFIISGFLNLIYLDKEGDKRYKSIIEENISNYTKQIQDEHKVLSNLIKLNPQNKFPLLNHTTSNPYFIFKRDSLIYWSTNANVPSYSEIQNLKSISFLKINKDAYLVYKTDLFTRNKPFSIVSFLPLYIHPGISTDRNKSGFNHAIFKNIAKDVSNTSIKGSFKINLDNDLTLFYVKPVKSTLLVSLSPSKTTLFLFLIGMTLLVSISIYSIRIDLNKQKYSKSISILVLTALLVRGSLFILGLPWHFIDLDKSFSNNHQLGEELISLVFVTIVLAFCSLWQAKALAKSKYLLYSDSNNILVSSIINWIGIAWSYLCYSILIHAHENSFIKVEYNIQNSFINQKVFSYLYFFLAVAIYFFGSHLTTTIYYQLNKKNNKKGFLTFIYSSLLAIFICYYLELNLFIVFSAAIFALCCYTFNLPKYLYIIKFQTFFYFLCLAFLFSIFTYQAFHLLKKPNIADQKMKQELSVLLSNLERTLKAIEKDKNLTNTIAKQLQSDSSIKNYIERNILTSYLKKSGHKIYIFDAKSKLISDNSKLSYENLKKSIENHLKIKNGIYIKESPNKDFHLSIISEKDSAVIIIQTQFIPDFPTENIVYSKNDLSFSYFDKNDNLITSKGDSVYSKSIFNALNFKESFNYNVPFISNSNTNFFSTLLKNETLSKFSLYFLFSVLAIINLLLFLAILNGFKFYKLSFSSKIQFYLNIILTIPVTLIVSIIVFTVINSFTKQQNESLVRNTYNISEIIDLQIQKLNSGILTESQLNKVLKDLSKTSGHDILVYTEKGKLKFNSSSENVYPKYMNPAAFSALTYEDIRGIITYEKKDEVNHKTVYSNINKNTNEIVAIPYIYSDILLEQQIEEIVSTLLIIFFILFVVLLLASFVISYNLTKPLQLLASTFQSTDLMVKNEKLHWKNDDEIGKLTQEYNSMITKLEESKEALAQSEKQAAWKNMTQQLAHEIKNPLTPMKLSIQQLQRILASIETENTSKFNQTLQKLNLQIDNISNIVNSFSEFANLPLPKTEIFNVTKTLQTSTDIQFIGNKKIEFNSDLKDLFAFGNQDILIKTVKNYVHQILDQCPEALIKVSIIENSDKILIVVENTNEEARVINLNLSTDESSNLELQFSILKRGIEHTGGHTWSETQDNNTLHFYIELPKAFK